MDALIRLEPIAKPAFIWVGFFIPREVVEWRIHSSVRILYDRKIEKVNKFRKELNLNAAKNFTATVDFNNDI